MFRKIKNFIQRGQRGFSDKDLWSFDYHLSELIMNGLIELKRKQIGYPPGLTEKEWDEILDKMIHGFYIGISLADGDYETSHKYNIALKHFDKGMDLFKKYFFNLWI